MPAAGVFGCSRSNENVRSKTSQLSADATAVAPRTRLELKNPAQHITFPAPRRLHPIVPRGIFSFEGVATKGSSESCPVKSDTMVVGTNYHGSPALARFLYDGKFVLRYVFSPAINSYALPIAAKVAG
jgi:hypothetical protein